MVERGGLENRCGLLGHRGFESLSLRNKKKLFDNDCKQLFFGYGSVYKSSCFTMIIPSRIISNAMVWLQRPRL